MLAPLGPRLREDDALPASGREFAPASGTPSSGGRLGDVASLSDVLDSRNLPLAGVRTLTDEPVPRTSRRATFALAGAGVAVALFAVAGGAALVRSSVQTREVGASLHAAAPPPATTTLAAPFGQPGADASALETGADGADDNDEPAPTVADFPATPGVRRPGAAKRPPKTLLDRRK